MGSDSNSGQFAHRRTVEPHRNWTLTPIYGVANILNMTQTIRMFEKISLLVFIFSLAACVANQPVQRSSVASTTVDPCTYEKEHSTADGNVMESGYYCSVFLPAGSGNTKSTSYVTSQGCSLVNSYVRKDGNTVGPFFRCKSYSDASTYRLLTAASEVAPCVSSYCGPVHVNGYYRKDGTYVRPYTRKK